MNHRLYLCLAAIAMVIAASSIGVSGGKMSKIMNRFHSSSGSSSSAASSASASSYSSSGSSVAGGRRGFSPRHVHHGQHGKYQQSAQQLHYPPAPVPAYNYAASGAEAQVNAARSARNGGSSSAASSAATSGYGSSASGASSASGSGSAAAAAAAAAAGGSASGSASSLGGRANRPVFHKAHHHPRGPHYAPEVAAYPAPLAHQPEYKGAPSFPTMPHVAAAPRYSQHNRFNGGGVSSSAAAAAAAGGAASAAAAANNGGHYGAGGHGHGHGHGHQHGHRHGNVYDGGVASASAAARTGSMSEPFGYNGYNVEEETSSEHYSEPETVDEYAAGTGTYSNDGNGLVTSSYVRSTDDKEIHEDGKEDDDHYYNAGSYGKTYDDNHHESYNNDDEDIIHTPTMFRSKKSSTNYMKDKTKTRRESGSSVLAKDKHSASYNKNIKKFKENVDQHTHKEGEGVLENSHSSESSDFDEEDEEAFDSRNLGTFTGLDGVYHARRPIFNPAAAAAASASSAGVSSSSSAGSR